MINLQNEVILLKVKTDLFFFLLLIIININYI